MRGQFKRKTKQNNNSNLTKINKDLCLALGVKTGCLFLALEGCHGSGNRW